MKNAGAVIWAVALLARRALLALKAIPQNPSASSSASRGHGLALTGRTESVTKLAAFASAAEMGPRRFDTVVILASPTGFEPVLPP